MALPGFVAWASPRNQNTSRHALIRNFVTSINSITPARLTEPNPETEYCGQCNGVRENKRECKKWMESTVTGGFWYTWYEDCCPPGYKWYQKGPGSYNGKCCKRRDGYEACLPS